MRGGALAMDVERSVLGEQRNGASSLEVAKRAVEDVYKKVSPREHILLRPDTYIGSVQPTSLTLWVPDEEGTKMVMRELTFVPGLYKIFDEILVNAADHKQRDPSMDTLKVEIDVENNKISVFNNGRGIPVEMHKTEKCYVPELIFGHLLTSSNYDDNEKKVVGGRNGYGAKLANVYSTEFIVETADSNTMKSYKQVFRNNMETKLSPDIRSLKKMDDWTRISFRPDLAKFGMETLDEHAVALMKKRVYDVAGCNPSLRVFLNGQRLPIRSFKSYVAMYLSGDETESCLIHDRSQSRWEVVVMPSSGQFTNVSFANSIWTMKGGTHVTQVTDSIVAKLAEHITKKNKGLTVKPFQIKSHLFVFVNCLIENPSFDSQTKENMTSRQSSFGSKWVIPEEMTKKLVKSGIIDNILAFARFKQSTELKKTDGGKSQRVLGVPKLDDANFAGTKTASKCTLILTEGDSAKALAVSGLSVVGRDYYGVFPLRGKLLNVREANHKQIMDNAEINSLKKIIGLQHGKKYDEESVKALRYGHVLIMTDQDHDGSHIKGLLINFFEHFWPGLIQVPGFLQEFITPIVKCSKGKQELSFFTMPEYRKWEGERLGDMKGWKVKYYKGLGTSTASEAKQYFSNLKRHLLEFQYSGQEDNDSITLAFAKEKVDKRKEWLADFEPGTFFDHVRDDLTFSNFVNKELVLFSLADNERSIPCIVDGLKPSQRKVLYACFKRKLKSEIKVAQLAGYVSEHAAYHHGEASLMSTILGLAQDFVGSNNINLLIPSGQFGTRLQGGKDAASPRYIFTKLSPIARAIFQEMDDPILESQEEEGMVIEPKWFCPIIPMVLVNGADGIGTGWSTSVPSYNPLDIIENLKRLIRGEDTQDMVPWFRGFNGSVVPITGSSSFDVHGVVYHSSSESDVVIRELPIHSWTTPYKEWIESCIAGQGSSDNTKFIPLVKKIRDQSTENKVDLTISLADSCANEANDSSALYKRLKLSGSIATSNMVLFDERGKIRKYEDPREILCDFFQLRLEKYSDRRKYILADLAHKVEVLENKVRFILMVVNGKLKVAKRSKTIILQDLNRLGFLRDDKKNEAAPEGEDSDSESVQEELSSSEKGYDYLLSMPLWSLTLERVESLKKERDNKVEEKMRMEKTTPEELWMIDLDALDSMIRSMEVEREREMQSVETAAKAAQGKKSGKGRGAGGANDNLDLGDLIDPPAPRTKAVVRARKGKNATAEDAFDRVLPNVPSSRPGPVTSEQAKLNKKSSGADLENSDSDSDIGASLSERLARRMNISREPISIDSDGDEPRAGPSKKAAAKRARAPKPKSAPTISPASKTPEAKRRNAGPRKDPKQDVFAFNGASEGSGSDDSVFEAENIVAKKPPARANRGRGVVARIILSSSEDEEDEDDENDRDFA